MGKYLDSRTALNEVGERLKAYRIDFPLTQKELSVKSGVALRSISRMENGEDVQFGSLIKVLIALDLDSNIDMLIPDYKKRPSYYLKENKAQIKRQRVRKKESDNQKQGVKWGDDK